MGSRNVALNAVSSSRFIFWHNGEHVHPYQRGRGWLSGLRLNGWKGMKTERLVGVARCGLIGLLDYCAEDRSDFQGQIIEATITPPSGKATKLKM
jgi:hypothetical protein